MNSSISSLKIRTIIEGFLKEKKEEPSINLVCTQVRAFSNGETFVGFASCSSCSSNNKALITVVDQRSQKVVYFLSLERDYESQRSFSVTHPNYIVLYAPKIQQGQQQQEQQKNQVGLQFDSDQQGKEFYAAVKLALLGVSNTVQSTAPSSADNSSTTTTSKPKPKKSMFKRRITFLFGSGDRNVERPGSSDTRSSHSDGEESGNNNETEEGNSHVVNISFPTKVKHVTHIGKDTVLQIQSDLQQNLLNNEILAISPVPIQQSQFHSEQQQQQQQQQTIENKSEEDYEDNGDEKNKETKENNHRHHHHHKQHHHHKHKSESNTTAHQKQPETITTPTTTTTTTSETNSVIPPKQQDQ